MGLSVVEIAATEESLCRAADHTGKSVICEEPMAKNRFEQVDELQPDAINLTLIQKSDGQVGIVHCPKTAAPDRVPADLTTPEIPVRDAVVGAIELANSKKIPIVVIDRDNIWKSEWGDLWRYQEEDE
jgi:hypothetical protein